MRHSLIASLAVLAMSGLLLMTLPARAQGVAIDGDTFRLNGVTYRAVGFDAPERRGKCVAEKMLAHLAAVKLQQLLRSPHIEVGVAPGLDKYGRSLAVLRYAGEPIADTMVEDGLAVRYNCPGNRCPARINWCVK